MYKDIQIIDKPNDLDEIIKYIDRMVKYINQFTRTPQSQGYLLAMKQVKEYIEIQKECR